MKVYCYSVCCHIVTLPVFSNSQRVKTMYCDASEGNTMYLMLQQPVFEVRSDVLYAYSDAGNIHEMS